MKGISLILVALLALTMQTSAQKLAEHVILIGLDGWAAHDLDNTRNNIPNIRSLIKNGSCNMHKRSVLPSDSGVNWASMFMGVGPEMHGYTTWDSKKHDLPSSTTNNSIPASFPAFASFKSLLSLISK